MSSNTALLNWIKSPDRTKSELMDAHKEHSADGHLLDAIEAQLDKRWPHWKEKQKLDIRRRTLTEAEVMAQIDSALERAAGISKAKYESSNVVVNLLSTFGDASGSASITFMINLNLTFPARETVIAGLVEMNGNDAELLHNQANGVGAFLRGAGLEVGDTVSGGGKGVVVMGLNEGDQLASVCVLNRPKLAVIAQNGAGREQVIKLSESELQANFSKRSRMGKAIPMKPKSYISRMVVGD